jgi:ABC-type glycerol-3-phosphate transport system substrate-binding protein
MIRGQSLMAIDWGDIGPAAFRDESSFVTRSDSRWLRPPPSTTTGKLATGSPHEPNYAPVHQFNGWAMYMASTSKKKQAAWEFMRHFVSPDVSIEVVSDPAGGYQPWRTSHSTNHQFWEDRGWKSGDAEEYAKRHSRPPPTIQIG